MFCLASFVRYSGMYHQEKSTCVSLFLPGKVVGLVTCHVLSRIMGLEHHNDGF